VGSAKLKEIEVARITVEDCLDQVTSRFLLVHMAARRVRQLRDGAEPLVNAPKNEYTVVALREIAAGKIVVAPKEPDVDLPEETDMEEETAS
jgi:DNA-directed RNA polymerase subunit omega